MYGDSIIWWTAFPMGILCELCLTFWPKYILICLVVCAFFLTFKWCVIQNNIILYLFFLKEAIKNWLTLLHHVFLAKSIWTNQKRGQEGPKRKLEKREYFTLPIKFDFMTIAKTTSQKKKEGKVQAYKLFTYPPEWLNCLLSP